tara:strand:- start:170 stop:307 length:138 start_codon:yes stop_codon:yes gene_type:complete
MREVIVIALCFFLFIIIMKQFKPHEEPVSVELFTDKEIEEWQPFD